MVAIEREITMKKKQQNNRKAQLLETLRTHDARTLDQAALAKVNGGYCWAYWPEPCRSTICGSGGGSQGEGRDY